MDKKKILNFGFALLFTILHIGSVTATWWVITYLFKEDFNHFLKIACVGMWIYLVFKYYLEKAEKSNE